MDPTTPYVSCIRINGRPILPPVMTPERRQECRVWKQKAIEVEKRLSKAAKACKSIVPTTTDEQSNDIEEVSQENVRDERDDEEEKEDEEDDNDDDEMVIFVSPRSLKVSSFSSPRFPIPNAKSSDLERSPPETDQASAFKSVILKLKSVVMKESTDEKESPTKGKEKPNRQRNDSYTLDEPSPSLKAYLEEHGENDMSFSARTAHVVDEPINQPPERIDSWAQTDTQLLLDQFLSDVSKMPSLKQNFKQAYFEGEDDVSTQPTYMATEHDLESVASSAKNSMSLPFSTNDTPRTVLRENEDASKQTKVGEELPNETSENSNSSQSEAKTTIETPFTHAQAERNSTEILSSVDASRPGTVSSTRQVEEAVSSLAMEQKRKIEELMKEQARQREELRRMFEEQQRELIGQILSTAKPSLTASLPFNIPRSASPVVPAAAPYARPLSSLPQDYNFPPKALTPEMHPKWCRLSALIKGFLVRRLLNTSKVQGLITAMKDTMSMALQLQEESKNNLVSKEDVELHGKLLHQLDKDSREVYRIFFDLSIPEKMSIIAMDHEIRRQTKPEKKEKRLSAVTLAKLEERQKTGNPQLGGPVVLNTKRDKENRRARSKSFSSEKDVGSYPLYSRNPRRSLFNITSSVSSSSNFVTKSPIKKKSTSKDVKPVAHRKPWK